MVDVFDPRTFARGVPHEDLRLLRDTEPVSWQPEPAIGIWPAGPGFWAVTRYDDVRHVLRSPAEFSSALGATQIRDPDPADLPFIRRMILNMDPPEQLRLRRLVTGAFTRRRLERFADTVRPRAAELLDRVAGRPFDLPPEVTDDFPLQNLADLLGVPAADRELLLRWTNRVIGYQDPEHAHVVTDADGRPVNPRSPAQLADMFDYAAELAERKRAEPADDVMTALVPGRGRRPAADRRRAEDVLLPAGHRGQRHRAQRAARRGAGAAAEPRRLPAAARRAGAAAARPIEEMLRVHPPVLTFRRTVARPVELGGRKLAVGDKVVVYHVSAHYDERRFPDPHRFDPAREPNEHLAFGQGPHLCLGAAFARLQLREFFTELLARPPVEPAGEPRRLTSNFINGITALPLRW